jgi:hypothetical protein
MNAFKALFTTYLSHLVGYIANGTAIAAVIWPTGIPVIVRLAISIAGIAIGAAHHGYQAGALTNAAQAAVAAATQALASTPAKLVVAALMLCPFLGLHGCAQVAAFEQSPTGATVIQASVDVAVATAEAKGISAAQINSIARQALAADQSGAATLAAVTAVVNADVTALKLPAVDQAAADILLAALSAAVQAKVGSNATLAQAQASAAFVINYVIIATGG